MSMQEYTHLLQRYEDQAQALAASSAECAALSVRNAALERVLRSYSSAEANAEKEVAVLQQRLARANEEIASMAEEVRKACSLDITLTHVQRELANTQHELSDKTQQLQELHAYYASVLEAKESSVVSLQALLASHQAAHQEQQSAWEEQRTALQDALMVLQDSAEADNAAASPLLLPDTRASEPKHHRDVRDTRQQADLVLFLQGKVDKLERGLRGLAQEKEDLVKEKGDLAFEVKELVRERGQLQRRLQGQEAKYGAGQEDLWESRIEEMEAKMERERHEIGRRTRVLEAHLRDREKLLVKADKRYQELTRKYMALGNALETAVASPASAVHPSAAVPPYPQALELQSLLASSPRNAFTASAPALKGSYSPDLTNGFDVGSMKRDAQLSSEALQHARAQLLEATSARETLQQQLHLIQEAFEEECRKSDQMRTKLTSKLKSKTLQLLEKDTELAARAAEVASSKALLEAAQKQVEALQRAADATQQGSRESSEAARQRERTLQAELDSLRAEVLNAKAELAAANAAVRTAQADAARAEGGASVLRAAAEEAESRHASRVKDLEAQLQHMATSGGPKCLAVEAELRQQKSRCSKLEAELEASSDKVHQLQHTLFVVRSHWGRLRQLLTRLHVAVQEDQQASALQTQTPQLSLEGADSAEYSRGRPPAIARSSSMDQRVDRVAAQQQAQQLLDQLLSEWDLCTKEAFDAAAEASMGAAATLLEEAASQFQVLSKRACAAGAASEAHAAQVKALSEQREVALRQAHELQLQLSKERLDTRAAEQGMHSARSEAERSECQASAASQEASELREALHAERRATQSALSEVASASAQMAQLQAKLRDKMGQAGDDLRLKQEETVRTQRAITDLQTNVAMLHVRLEQSQANASQVENLKARVARIMARVAVPRVLSSHPISDHEAQQLSSSSLSPPLGPNQGQVALSGQSGVVGPGGGVAGLGVAAGGDVMAGIGSRGVEDTQGDDELVSALEHALGQTQSVVAATALLEACHWELERGLAAVGLAQAHMGALRQELAAGRMSTALVMAQELQTIMDLPTSHPSTSPSLKPSRAAHSTHRLGMADPAAGPLSLQAPTRSLNPAPPHTLTLTPPHTGLSPSKNAVWDPASAASTAGTLGARGGAQAAQGAGGGVSVSKLQSDLEAARRASMHAASGAKTVEALLLGLQQALPEWTQIARVQCHSQYKAELSRLRMLAGSGAPQHTQHTHQGDGATTASQSAQGIAAQQPSGSKEDGVASVRERMLVLQKEHSGLAAECSLLQAQLLAMARRSDQLVGVLQRTLPLPPELLQGLKDGLASPQDQKERDHKGSSSSSSNRKQRKEQHKGQKSSSGNGDSSSCSSSSSSSDSSDSSSEREKRERRGKGVKAKRGERALGVAVSTSKKVEAVFGRAVAALEQLVLSFLQQLEASGVAQGQQQALGSQEVANLRETCRQQQQQVEALQAQLQSLLHHAQQALEAAHAEGKDAASGALHSALESMRDEADEVQAALQQLSKSTSSTWATTLQAWQEGREREQAAASQAISALQAAAANLQERLSSEVQAHKASRSQMEEDVTSAQEQAVERESSLRRVETELQSVRQQLAASQRAQEALVKESVARHKQGMKPLSTVAEAEDT